jgi:hypothetical protein
METKYDFYKLYKMVYENSLWLIWEYFDFCIEFCNKINLYTSV